MTVAVIIPVGPGHERPAIHAERSARLAWATNRGPFKSMRVAVVDDTRGALGRSAARNRGMNDNPADWHFLLDADDAMMTRAFPLVDLDAAATFGTVWLCGRRYFHDRWPLTRADIGQHGARGTLSMGCFVRGDLGLRFDESMDIGEDFDFYMRLPGWTKRDKPLVNIGYREPSATGPRSQVNGDWLGACNAVIAKYAAVPA